MGSKSLMAAPLWAAEYQTELRILVRRCKIGKNANPASSRF
jgi:hypothetical protein